MPVNFIPDNPAISTDAFVLQYIEPIATAVNPAGVIGTIVSGLLTTVHGLLFAPPVHLANPTTTTINATFMNVLTSLFL